MGLQKFFQCWRLVICVFFFFFYQVASAGRQEASRRDDDLGDASETKEFAEDGDLLGL